MQQSGNLLATLGLLARATGEAVTSVDVGRRALDVLCSMTAASSGLIAEIRDGGYEVLADRALPEPLRPILAGIDPATSPLIAALRPPGSVLSAPVDSAPLVPEVRRTLAEAGVRWLAIAGLHVRGETVGLFALAWDRDPPGPPMTDALAHAASSLAITLENTRLVSALRVSEARYRAVFDNAPIGIIVSDLDELRVVHANVAAERLYAASPGGLVGIALETLTRTELPERERRLETIHATGGGQFLSTARRLDGSRFPCELTVSLIDLAGQLETVAIVRDLSEERRLQAELVQAQKMEAIGQLMAGVAHELNNPLAAIIGFSQIIGADPSLPTDLRGSASLLVSEAERTRRIVQNLLDFARQRPPERTPTRLRQLVESVVELSGYGIAAAQVSVELDVPDELPPVALDRQQMQQVLLNLLTNAVQAIRSTGRPGRVRFQAVASGSPEAPGVRLTVSDDGPGVPPDQRDRLFVPFFTTKPPAEGTGLGLSVSFGIVAAHGGRLWFEPAHGAGATFVLELPLSAGEEAPMPLVEPPTGPAAAPRAGDRGKVVVLDDEPAIRAFLGKALQLAGYEPILVADGPAAIRAIRADHEVAAILCDHRMAGMSGTDVFTAAVAARPDLRRRFVFMSGDVLNPELRTFAEANGVRLLAKPFDLETIGRVVRETLDAPAARRRPRPADPA